MCEKISVCMASYNGKEYIQEQIETILANLLEEDELIISDDGSTDGTLDVLDRYSAKYPQIKVARGPRQGVVRNFENAIRMSSGDLIFLSDQDDLWTKDKAETVKECFAESRCTCVVHNADVIDSCGKVLIPSYFTYRNSGPGIARNILKNSYIGCCMAFRKELLPYVLPFPDDIHMHDQWIGILSDYYGHSCFCDKILLHYRRHEGNVTGLRHSSCSEMIRNRTVFIKEYHKRILEKKKI